MSGVLVLSDLKSIAYAFKSLCGNLSSENDPQKRTILIENINIATQALEKIVKSGKSIEKTVSQMNKKIKKLEKLIKKKEIINESKP